MISSDRTSQVHRALAVLGASLGVIASLWYVFLNQTFDGSTLLAGVVLPLAFGAALLLATRQRVALFAFIALFWSLVDDAPVYFDSVYTWPEVTRFHPAGPHIFLEVVLHLLTLFFIALALREALKGRQQTFSRVLVVSVLGASALVLSYAQNIPLSAFQSAADSNWYSLDFVEHLASLAVLALAIREATRSRE